jgi:predicted nuclease with RNAse H fold
MKNQIARHQFSIGWDVGGWNCDKNPKSRDAIVILDAEKEMVGTPWRGNLRETINRAVTSRDWLEGLFAYCRTPLPSGTVQAVLAIDAPLGFSTAFMKLITGQGCCENPVEKSQSNPYLFRRTAQFLFEKGLQPLSAVKDMIGSQATKAMHVLAKFTPSMGRCGVWTDGEGLQAIETYPSACKRSHFIQDQLKLYKRSGASEEAWLESLDHNDKQDALVCALIGHAFLNHPNVLAYPPDSIPEQEGWIWVPKDGL